VAIHRTSQLLFDDQADVDASTGMKPVVGVRITETVDCRLIDFGLVKYMCIAQYPPVISPGTFGGPAAALPGQGSSAFNMSNPETKKTMGFDDDDDGPPAPPQAQQPPKSAFPIAVTPCGTELYCSLEAIEGIISSGVGRTKWQSSSAELPKLDVYGVGTMAFCMANGQPPFRPPDRELTREERRRQVQRLIANGPIFNAGVSEEAKAFISTLMTNEAARRPDATAALNLPFLQFVAHTNDYSYEVFTDGRVRVVEARAQPTPLASGGGAVQQDSSSVVSGSAPNADSAGARAPAADGKDADDADAQEDGELVDDVMSLLRGKEDDGDAAGKPRPSSEKK